MLRSQQTPKEFGDFQKNVISYHKVNSEVIIKSFFFIKMFFKRVLTSKILGFYVSFLAAAQKGERQKIITPFY